MIIKFIDGPKEGQESTTISTGGFPPARLLVDDGSIYMLSHVEAGIGIYEYLGEASSTIYDDVPWAH